MIAYRKWLRAPEQSEPKYVRGAQANKLTAYHDEIKQALKADARRPKRARRTARALYQQIKAAGYKGGYSRITDFIRAWKQSEGQAALAHAFVPLAFELGEAFQFDWSEEGLVVGGIFYKAQVSHMKLCASRAFWLVAYPSQGHEMLFDAHTRSFAALGGIARRGIYECKGRSPPSGTRICHSGGPARGSAVFHDRHSRKGNPMPVATVGIDLAKSVFAVHGIGASGLAEVRRPEVRRAKLLELVASWPPCLIGMETCSGAHHWAREFQKLGHTVRLMAPKFVAPYRMAGQRGKNDANDAAAICEAVSRPSMRFVPIKSIDQQAELFLHRARQGYIEERTALINRIRGIMSELGIILPMRASALRRDAHQSLEKLPGWCKIVVSDLLRHLARLDERVIDYDKHIGQAAQQNERASRLMRLAGVGPMTASAIVATIGNGHDFKNSRQFSAWLGLTPGQNSSGGKARLGGITKAGDSYLRTLLVMGARSLLMRAANHSDPVSRWASKLRERRGFGRTVVAIASKNARMCWAMLRLGDAFKLPT